jgi:hypothetical protein
MDMRAELLSVLARELTRCRSCRSLPLFSLSLSLLLYPLPSSAHHGLALLLYSKGYHSGQIARVIDVT